MCHEGAIKGTAGKGKFIGESFSTGVSTPCHLQNTR